MLKSHSYGKCYFERKILAFFTLLPCFYYILGNVSGFQIALAAFWNVLFTTYID
jgi:hypothetical protein